MRVAGFMLEASVKKRVCGNSCLLSFGEQLEVTDAGDAKNPGLISDIFTGVEGSNHDRTVSAEIKVCVHSRNVVRDNLWLLKADHINLRDVEEPNQRPLLYHQIRMFEEKDVQKIVNMYTLF